MIDPSVPGSPDWWLDRLTKKQLDRLPKLHRLHRYGIGDHDLPEGDQKVRETFCKFQRRARSNYTGLVAESVLERLRITSFSAGAGATAKDDSDAWHIWQSNHMDADAPLVFRAALYMGEAYMMVGPPRPGSNVPVISAEDPREMVVELDPVDKRVVRAALKIYADDIAGQWRAVLLLPDAIYAYMAPLVTGGTTDQAFGTADWERANNATNPLGRVPVVRFPNRLDINGCVQAEYQDVMDVQDRINNTILDRLVISKMQAYRQRWVRGWNPEDEDGNIVEPFKPGADLVWAVDDPDVEFGEFQQADTRQVIEAVAADVRDLGAISRTPPHYLLGEFINASGDAFAQSETGHVAKVKERMSHYGEAAEEVIRLAFAYLGDPRADSVDTEVGWADPQYRSLAEKADAAGKLVAAGVPWRTVMISVLGYSPQEVARMEAERTSDALLALMSSPTTQPPTTGPQEPAQSPAQPEQPPQES